jgi:hypothetical protein
VAGLRSALAAPGTARLAGVVVALAGIGLLIFGVVVLAGGDPAPSGAAPAPASPSGQPSSPRPSTGPSTRPSTVPSTVPSTSAAPAPAPSGAPTTVPRTTVVVPPPPSPTPTRTSAARAPVTVLNNSVITGLADRAAAEVQSRGWQIAQVGNFAGRLEVTTVYYSPGVDGEEAAARELASEFGQVSRVLPRYAGLPPTPAGIVLVVTKDW